MKFGILRAIIVSTLWVLSCAQSATASNHLYDSDVRPSGGMDSGGAAFYGTDMNPWFLQNTESVTYCLDVNPQAFHQSLEVVDTMIQNAVQSWRRVFADSAKKDPVILKPYGVLRIASQTFKRVACSNAVDVRFQLGTLTPEQKTQLGNYRQWIGAAYRTNYDTKKLKGRGFVYIAADAGPDRSVSSELVSDVWTKCQGCLLERTIVHEMGHIFGIGHIGNDWDIMSERHLEKVTSKEWHCKHLSTLDDVNFFRERSQLGGYLSFPRKYSAKDCTTLNSDPRKRLRTIFDIPESEQCVSFTRGRTQGCGNEMTTFSYTDSKFNRHFIADECKDAGRSEVAWLYLPDEQNVLTLPRGTNSRIKLPIAIAYERTICAGSVYEGDQKLPIAMSIITSRDGVFAGAAFEANSDRPEIFSSSMD